jgi:hypothetical protein
MSMVVSMVKREFDPETIQVMSVAFESAWRSLSDSGSVLASEFRAASTKERLARCILNLAQSGERDAERLQRLAKAALMADLPRM